MRILTTWIVSFGLAFGSVGSLGDVPMTKWGKPSLQGNWDFRTVTPFQRPAAFADKEFLTVNSISRLDGHKSLRKTSFPSKLLPRGSFNIFILMFPTIEKATTNGGEAR